MPQTFLKVKDSRINSILYAKYAHILKIWKEYIIFFFLVQVFDQNRMAHFLFTTPYGLATRFFFQCNMKIKFVQM